MNDVSNLRRELKSWIVDSVIPMLFGFTLLSKTTSIGDQDAVELSDEGAAQKSQRRVTRLSPWGLVSVPVKGIRGLALRLGASNVLFIGLAPQQKYGPQNLKAGETCLYSKTNGTRVFLDENGSIRIDAASGQDVIVNGGGAKVHRFGDHSNAGTLTITLTGTTALSGAYVDPDGVSTPLTSGVPITLKAKANEGADHFKA
jgi:phage gp45-like